MDTPRRSSCFNCFMPSSARQNSSNNKADKAHNQQQKYSIDSRDEDQSQMASCRLQAIADLINEDKIAKSSVIVMIGAGISISAGVPDLRLSDENIHAKLQQHHLKSLDDVFKLSYFKNNPAPFYDLSRNLLPSRLYPTLAHYFIRLLDEKGYLMRCYSQNVDCLESFSGLPKDKVCLSHGSFELGYCLRCNAEYEYMWMRQVVDAGGIPHCTNTHGCKGLIKPNIRFSGELIDKRFFRLVKEDFPKCQLLILIGVSLNIIPFNQLPDKAPQACPRLYINKIRCNNNLSTILARLFKIRNSNIVYDNRGNIREVFHQASCDDACLELANLLGWTGELIEMAKFGRDHLERLQEQQLT